MYNEPLLIRIIQEDMMALYSWFLRTDKKPIMKTVSTSNDLLKASQTVKYIENYTMWPTAKIKTNAEIIPPNFSNESLKEKEVLPRNTSLTIIKS